MFYDFRGSRLTLLWYHAVIRPFVALDEGNNEEGLCVSCVNKIQSPNVSNVTAYFVSILFSSVLFPVIHSAHIAHEWFLLKRSVIILGWYRI